MTATAAATSLSGPQAEALELHEAATLAIAEGASSPIAPDGTVLIHVIRPGVGKGRGKHLYEASMLEQHAGMFAGKALDGSKIKRWKMFADHRSPEARKAAGGLPRGLRDTAGIIRESWWDGTVPADPAQGFGQGAVVAKVKPVPWVRELIETDPELVETSISATATSVKPRTIGGERVWLVEGINPRGSVDFVTEAGAGGRIAPLLEAAIEEGDSAELLEALDDDEFREYLAETRPDLLEALRTEKPDDHQEDDVDITPDALREALTANPTVLAEALTGSDAGKAAVNALIEAQVTTRVSAIEDQAQATTSRILVLARLESEAHRLIDESKLPDSWKAGLKARYQLDEAGEPSDALNVFDVADEHGAVTKSAKVVLREALEEDIKAEQTKLREARPTLVRGQGRGQGQDELDEGKVEPIKDAKKTTWGSYLSRTAGIDPSKAFDLIGAPAE